MEQVGPRRKVALQLISGLGHQQAVIDAVRQAEVSVWIATANLKDIRVPPSSAQGRSRFVSVLSIFDELVAAGVELRILHATMPSRAFRESFDKYPRLVRGGLELRLCPRVHFKVVIVDGAQIYLGSANWTGAGLGLKSEARRNFELGIASGDAQLIDEVQAYYQQIWSGDTCASCKRRDVCEAPLDL